MNNEATGLYPPGKVPFSEQKNIQVRQALRLLPQEHSVPGWVESLQSNLIKVVGRARVACLADLELGLLSGVGGGVELETGENAPGHAFPFHHLIVEKAWNVHFGIVDRFYSQARGEFERNNGYPFFQVAKLLDSPLSPLLPFDSVTAERKLPRCYADKYIPAVDLSLAWLVLNEKFGGSSGLELLRSDAAKHLSAYFRLERNPPTYRANGDLVLEGGRDFHAFENRNLYGPCPLVEALNIVADWASLERIPLGSAWEGLHKGIVPEGPVIPEWGSVRVFNDKLQFRICAHVGQHFIAFISAFGPAKT